MTRRQFRMVLTTNNLFLSDEQFYWLEQRYNDDMGFNYYKFLKDVDVDEAEVDPLVTRLILFYHI